MMRVIKDFGGDYYIYITIEEGKGVRIPENTQGGFHYPWLEARVESERVCVNETLGLTCSNDFLVSRGQGITFTRGEDEEYLQDINVRIFPSKLDKLLNGEIKFLMDCYDKENKLWIYLEESLSN